MNKLRIAAAWGAATVMLAGTGLLTAPLADAATRTWVATTSVNVRTGPGTSYAVLDQLAKGEVVLATGSASNGWLPISFADSRAYLYAAYVKTTTSTTTPITAGPATTKVTTAKASVLTAASADASVVATLAKGSSVAVTGRELDGFSEATVSGTARWVSTAVLGEVAGDTPATIADAVTTLALTLREAADTASTALGTVALGDTVAITGSHVGNYSQVVTGAGTVGWVLTGFLTVQSSEVAALPVAKARKYVKTASAPVRAKAAGSSERLARLEKNTVVQITGTTSGTFSAMVWDGSTAWIKTAKLKAAKDTDVSGNDSDGVDLGSSSLNKLEPHGKIAVLAVRERWPQITTMYGWRASSDYSSDHPNGRAVDVMIPNWNKAKGKALGTEIADYFIDTYQQYHITYIIWRQRTWTLARNAWKKMEDRGSATQNHMDHVHLSFEKS